MECGNTDDDGNRIQMWKFAICVLASGQPSKNFDEGPPVPSLGRPRPHGSVGPRESTLPPNVIAIGSVIFAQHISVTNAQTDTQTTLRATSVAVGRIHAVHLDTA